MEHHIISRSEWGARYRGGWPDYASTPTRPHRPLPATEAWLHYPGAKTPPGPDATFEEDAAYVRYLDQIGYDRFGPQTGTGWGTDTEGDYGAGISYSLIFPKSGRIFRGHEPGRVSSHTAGHNRPGMGYCVLLVDGEEANAAQIDAITWALHEQVRLGELATPRLNGGHRDVYATYCPTDRLYAQLPTINAQAAQPKETPVAKPAPTRQQLKDLAQEWRALGGEWYCTPWDWEAGRCAPGKHGHSADSEHFKGMAIDIGWPGLPIHALEALAVIVFQRYVDRTKPYDVRWLFNISATNHPDHLHGDAGEYNGPSWYDDVRDRGGVLARDGIDLFLPTTFRWHVPPINLGFTIGDIVAWQSKMRRAIRPSTGRPYYSGKVDGYHGKGSKQGTRDFQDDHGLTVDAKPGPATNAAMDRFIAAGSTLDLVQRRYDAIVKMIEAAGQNVAAYVTQVQKMLLAAGYDPKGIDGSPGEGFQTALGRFQKDHGLVVDYLPGTKTWAALVAASTPTAPEPVVPIPVSPTPPLAQRVAPHRVSGQTRWDTAVAAARHVLPDAGEGVILAADGTPDLMAAFQLAQTGVALALPVQRGAVGIPAPIRAFLAETRPDWIRIVGGPTSVTDTAAHQAFQAANLTL